MQTRCRVAPLLWHCGNVQWQHWQGNPCTHSLQLSFISNTHFQERCAKDPQHRSVPQKANVRTRTLESPKARIGINRKPSIKSRKLPARNRAVAGLCPRRIRRIVRCGTREAAETLAVCEVLIFAQENRADKSANRRIDLGRAGPGRVAHGPASDTPTQTCHCVRSRVRRAPARSCA